MTEQEILNSPTTLGNTNTSGLRALRDEQKKEFEAANQKEDKPDPQKIENDRIEAERLAELEASNKIAEDERLAAEKNKEEKPIEVDAHLKWLSEDDEPKEIEKPEKKETVAKAEISPEIKSKVEAYDKIMANPVMKALENFLKEGRTDITEFTKIVGAENYDAMTDEDLYKMDLTKYGLSPEEVEEAIAEFNEKPSYERKKIITPIKNSLKENAKEKLLQLSGVDPKKELELQTKQKEIIQSAVNELHELAERSVNKPYYGLLMTPEIIEVVQSNVMNNAQLSADGSAYDIKGSWDRAIRLDDKLFKKLLKANMELSKTQGYDEAMKSRTRVNRNDQSSGGDAPAAKRDVSKAISNMGVVKTAEKK